MKHFLLILFLGCASLARAQETGKPVDYANPKVGDYIRVEGYLRDWCSLDPRPDQIYEMDAVLDSMRLLPNWKFQLEVHTDCRASHAYNDTLSQMRADTLLARYLRKGFPAWRIKAKGMGERKLLLEKCSCDLTDYINQRCSEPEHQLNRRTVIRLVEKIQWTGHEPLSLKFPSAGQYRAIPMTGPGDEAYRQANSQLWPFLDSLKQYEGLYFTLYYLPGKEMLTKPFVNQRRKKDVTTIRFFEGNPSRMRIVYKRPGQTVHGFERGYVVLIDSLVSPKKIMDEVGISGDSIVTISDVVYIFQKPLLLEALSPGGLQIPLENVHPGKKYRLYIVTTDYRNCVEYYHHINYKKWIACQDTAGVDYIGYSKRMREEFPDFPEIVEVVYLDVPDIKRPWMLILQPVKEGE